MLLDYGFKSISDYLYHYELATLKCLMAEYDQNNASRYYESYLCRMIADNVSKVTMQSMLQCDTTPAAVFRSIQLLSYNALHLSLLPVVHERLLSRLIQYEPLLGMATVGLTLDIPVISLDTLLLFFDGRPIINRAEYTVLRDFCLKCWETDMFVNRGCIDGGDYGTSRSSPVPYITSAGDWDSAPGAIREKISLGGTDKKQGDDIMNLLSNKLYGRNAGVLDGCAFCKTPFTFQQCIKTLSGAFDLRGFFGGMSVFHDSRRLLQSLEFPSAHLFPTNFIDPCSSNIDTSLAIARLSGDVYGISLNIWSALLWFSLMKRPRRDPGIVNEFAHSLTTLSVKMLPKSVFPYPVVPMTRLDPFTGEQVVMDLRDNSDDTDDRGDCPIIRFKNKSITGKNFVMECKVCIILFILYISILISTLNPKLVGDLLCYIYLITTVYIGFFILFCQ
jgi:hypothetical protein